MATKITTRVLADNAVTDAKIADVTLTTSTQSASDNTTKIATTAYVTTALANLADSAPSTLNTLNELAAALGDDANYATTTTNAIAAKLPLAGGTLSGNLLLGDNDITGINKLSILDGGDNNRLEISGNASNSFIFDMGGTGSVGKINFNDFNVGIGIAAPAQPLHVYEGAGGYYASIGRGNSAPGGADPWLGLFNNTSIADATYGWGMYDSNSDGSFQIWGKNNSTTGTAALTIARGGNVGIGEISPLGKLHVKAQDTGATANAVGNLLVLEGTENGLSILSSTSGAGYILFGDSDDNAHGGILYDQSAGAMRFRTGSTWDQMKILANGNVGIGTANPFSKLQTGNNTFSGGHGMYANARVGISNHGSLTGMMLASTYNDASHPDYGLVFVQGPSTSSYNVWSISPDGPAKGTGLNFHYGAQATNIHGASHKRITFKGDGSVIIGSGGTTTYNAALQVKGDITTTVDGNAYQLYYTESRDFITNSGATSIIKQIDNDANSAKLLFRAWDNSTLMTIMNSGNVGIGTAVPGATLDVGGGLIADPIVRIDSAAGGDPSLVFDTGAANRSATIKFHDQGNTAGGFINYLHNGDKMNFGAGSTTGVTMTVNDGKVGIARVSPDTTLDLEGALLMRANTANIGLGTFTAGSGMTALGGGELEFMHAWAGTMAVNDTIVFTYNAINWKSWWFEITAASTGGYGHSHLGGYWNNGGGTSTLETIDTNMWSVAKTASGQSIIITITLNTTWIHPLIKIKFGCGGGEGAPVLSRCSLVINS